MSDTKNELETLLEKAATEPAHRPAFFRMLLESTVWVPGTSANGDAVDADSALDLQHWEKEDGTSVIPFFSSLEALQQAVEDEQAFIAMPVRTLFEMTLGETLFLNAKLPTGKEFTPREISHLVSEEGNPLSTQEVIEGGQTLLLSEVAIIQAAGSVATDTLPGDEPIDICLVTEGEKGVSHFIMAHVTPFYERRWGSFLRDFKTNRII